MVLHFLHFPSIFCSAFSAYPQYKFYSLGKVFAEKTNVELSKCSTLDTFVECYVECLVLVGVESDRYRSIMEFVDDCDFSNKVHI